MSTNQDTQDISSADGWQGMEREQQDDLLNEKLEEEGDSLQSDPGSFEYAEMDREEKQSALERIEEKTQETWYGTVLEDVSMEFYRLQEKHINLLKEMAGLFARVSQAEDADDLSQEDIETLEEADEELEELLAEVTVDEEMTQEWWASGEYPADLKLEVFGLLYRRYKQGAEQVGN